MRHIPLLMILLSAVTLGSGLATPVAASEIAGITPYQGPVASTAAYKATVDNTVNIAAVVVGKESSFEGPVLESVSSMTSRTRTGTFEVIFYFILSLGLFGLISIRRLVDQRPTQLRRA